jgi:hypothetical protein
MGRRTPEVFMTTSATLGYSVVARGPITGAEIETAMAAVPLDHAGIEALLGVTLTSDTTTLTGTTAVRTIIYNITSAQFQAAFPVGTQQAPFWGLFQQTLSGFLAAFVTAADPVIA